MTAPRSFPVPGGEVVWTKEGSGPAVVLCHGTPWSSALWDGIAGDLARDVTVYRWDMLGYGRSTMADGDVSLRAQGEIFAALLRHWREHDAVSEPHVVAHDYGGAVALRAHLLHGSGMRSLALVDVVALAPWGSDFFRLVREHADVFVQLPERLHRALVREYIRGAAHQDLEETALDNLVQPWTGPLGQAAFYRQIAQADQRWTDEVQERYAEVTVPTLVAWGVEDAWIPVDRAERLAAAIPGARLLLVEGAGHLIQLDEPETLTAILRDWLSGPHTRRSVG